jgi:twinkle protein
MTYEEAGIEIPYGKSTGQVYTTCPQCSEDRKKKKNKCLSINLDLGVWNCKNCNWKGSIHKKMYALPKWENRTQLPDSIIEWFSQRNIGQDFLN